MSERRERPIIFSGAMILKTREGKKNQTRRVVKAQPGVGVRPYQTPDGLWNWVMIASGVGVAVQFRCPYGVVGDRLWARETWCSAYAGSSSGTLFAADWAYVPSKRTHEKGPHFCADYDDAIQRGLVRWRPSIYLPRWASRDTFEITNVRLERLQDITEEDAKAEGVTTAPQPGKLNGEPATLHPITHRQAFLWLWDTINGKRPGCAWADNPWVWVISYRRLSP